MVVQHQRPAIGPATFFILKRQRHQRSTAHQKVPLPAWEMIDEKFGRFAKFPAIHWTHTHTQTTQHFIKTSSHFVLEVGKYS